MKTIPKWVLAIAIFISCGISIGFAESTPPDNAQGSPLIRTELTPLTTSEEGESEGDVRKVETLEITGKVLGITRDTLALEYEHTSESAYERILSVNPTTRVWPIANLSELRPGDTIKVRYNEVYKKDQDQTRFILKSLATEITVLNSAPKEEPKEEPEEEEELHS